jgi:hypothetical protein
LYATADAAWTHRGGDFRDEIAGSFEAGARILDYYSVRGLIRVVRPVARSKAVSQEALFDPATSSPRSLTFDLVVGAEIFTGFTLEAGFSRLLSGRNTLAGTSIEAGVTWAVDTRPARHPSRAPDRGYRPL